MRPIPKLTRWYMWSQAHPDDMAVLMDKAVFWTCILAAIVVWAVQ